MSAIILGPIVPTTDVPTGNGNNNQGDQQAGRPPAAKRMARLHA
jgi:hypothetical protein